jgi:hypothetical protein
MVARPATKNDMKALRSIWMECFSLDDSYLDLVEKKLFPYAQLYVLEDRGEILSTFALIPIDFYPFSQFNSAEDKAMNGAYLAGVATPEKFRGNHYSSKLFEEVSKQISEYDFLLTRPAEESLINFYFQLGFNVPVNNPYSNNFFFKTCQCEGNKNFAKAEKMVESGKYNFSSPAEIREKIITCKKPCLVWGEKILDFVMAEEKFNKTTVLQIALFNQDNSFLDPTKELSPEQIKNLQENPPFIGDTPYAFVKIIKSEKLNKHDFYGSYFLFTLE